MGEDTVYNFVHPNNEGMIRFLASKGYTVLNMIEVRKPYKGEKLTTTISPNVPQQIKNSARLHKPGGIIQSLIC